jgi:excisionase family DNA binding protein
MQQYYTPNEVAETLRVTRRAVYEWLQTGRLRGLRAGNRWRIRPEDVEAFTVADPHMKQTSVDIAAEWAARVDAAFGKFAGFPGCVDEFLRRKHEDIEWESRRWADRGPKG